MARFNRFGAVHTQVLALYPGADLADFDDGGAAGQAKIEAALDRAAREVASALTPEVYKQMTEVDCQEVVRYAAAGQATATLGLVPVVAGTLHLWRYPNPEWVGGGARGGYGTSADYHAKPRLGVAEHTGHSLTTTTGALTGLSLSEGDRLFASYDVYVDSASFAMPSVADLVAQGAAAELGAQLYSHEMQEWKLVEEYRTRYAAALAAARSGEWIPDELRKLRYWTELDRTAQEVRSVRLYRG
jgi:hypothetical protein